MLLSVSAFVVSCVPYYPEYVTVVSLGASTDDVIVGNEEGTCSFNVISNIDYEALIVDGETWLSFADIDGTVRKGTGNGVLTFNFRANNHARRVARVVLAAETRRDTVCIKQESAYPEYLEVNPEDVEEYFILEEGTRMSVLEDGGQYLLRLQTSCLDHEITCWTDQPHMVSDFAVTNSNLSFRVLKNQEGQPRIANVELSYINGWDEKIIYKFSIKQFFNYDNAAE